jgi:hypothetical protein
MMNDEDRLVRILQLSHSQILAGNSYSQEEAEHLLNLYQKKSGLSFADIKSFRGKR